MSDALARSLWGNDNPIDKRIALSAQREAEVIGVAGNVRAGGLNADAGRTVYVATTQGAYNFMTVLVKTRKDPRSLVPSVRQIVGGLDAAVPLHHVRTLDAIVSSSVDHQRFQMLLVSGFSALMLLLAVVGTYGVTAYGVSERTSELGIRAALGATSNDIQRLVVGEGVRLAVVGIAIGGAIAATLASTLSRLVLRIGPVDITTFIAVPLLLIGAMMVATFIPAHRAARIDPMRALRVE